MKVEVWSDMVCPYCYIGKQRLEQAIQASGRADDMEIVFRSYQLDPNAVSATQTDVYQMLSEKYGMSREEAKAITQRLANEAAKEGLDFQFDSLIRANTMLAHRLALWADGFGKRIEMTARIFRAHFTESQDIGSVDVLVKLAAEIGLDAKSAEEALLSDIYSDEVKNENRDGLQLGIRGVPFFVFDRKFAVNGAQAPAVFEQAIQRAWAAREATI